MSSLEELRAELTKAQNDKDFAKIQSLNREIYKLQFANMDVDEDEDEGEPLDCSNVDLLDELAPKWTTTHQPDITILFRDPKRPNATPNKQCFNRKTLLRYIRSDDNDFRMWVPNRFRQLNNLPIDDDGDGGIPSIVEAYIRMPDHTLILIDPSFVEKLEPGVYEGVPLYEVRYGNGLGPDWVYVVVSSDEDVALSQLQRCLERHLRVRDPFGIHHYSRMHPTVVTKQSLVDAIRAVHTRFPVPVVDTMRKTDDYQASQEWNRFSFDLHSMVSPTDMYCLLAEKLSKGGGQGELHIPNAVVNYLTKNGYLSASFYEVVMNSYVAFEGNRLDNGDPYPAPIMSLKVVKMLLGEGYVIFRWNNLYWQPVYFGHSLGKFNDNDDIRTYLPEFTDMDIELMTKSKTVPSSYRLVTAKSSDEMLELLEFSTRPRLALKSFIAAYISDDFLLSMSVRNMIDKSQYYVRRTWTAGIRDIPDKSAEGINTLYTKLKFDNKVSDFLIISHIDEHTVLTATKYWYSLSEDSWNVAAVREMSLTDSKFRKRVLSLQEDLDVDDIDYYLTNMKEVGIRLVATLKTKRLNQGEPRYRFSKAIRDPTVFSTSLGPDEIFLDENPEVGFEMLTVSPDKEFTRTFIKLYSESLTTQMLNRSQMWSNDVLYVNFSTDSDSKFSQEIGFLYHDLKLIKDFQSKFAKSKFKGYKESIQKKVKESMDDVAIPSLYLKK